jgi:hypothetical protein
MQTEAPKKKSRKNIIKGIVALIGSLSGPSKMPCNSWSISNKKCIQGMKLAKLLNSICSECYAARGNFLFPVVKAALEKRYEGLSLPNWKELMAELILLSDDTGYFRWFDSGDIQSLKMLEDIVWIAEQLPNIKFWLPTKEWGIVLKYKEKNGAFPANLTVRISSYLIESEVTPDTREKLGCPSSSVSRDKNKITCPAYNQGGICAQCRLCWDKNVENVCYKKH